jgi:hypothetical protein
MAEYFEMTQFLETQNVSWPPRPPARAGAPALQRLRAGALPMPRYADP